MVYILELRVFLLLYTFVYGSEATVCHCKKDVYLYGDNPV